MGFLNEIEEVNPPAAGKAKAGTLAISQPPPGAPAITLDYRPRRRGEGKAVAADVPVTSGRDASALIGQNRVSFLFWQPVRPFSGSLRHETADQSGRVSSRLQCAKNPLRRAFEMADLAAFLLGGHEVVLSFIDILY